MGVRSIKRNMAKNKYAYLKDKEKLNIINQKAEIFRNGITEKDIKEEFHRGFGAGWKEGRERLYKEVFSSICLVMAEDHSSEEIVDFLKAIDRRTQISIDANEDLDEVFERIGVQLDFKDDIDMVKEV